MIDDNPPEGFIRIDFDRGRPDPTFNTHIGNLYAKRGEKGTRDEFVMRISRAVSHVQSGGWPAWWHDDECGRSRRHDGWRHPGGAA